MAKKLAVLLLIFTLILSGLAACADDPAVDDGGNSTETEESSGKEASKKAEKSAYDKLSAEGKNAYKSAKNYLDLMAFSKKGLIQQLSSEYGDNYPKKVAKKAVKALEKDEGIDWNKEAKEAAQNYLDTMSFSKEGLIQQLESEYGDQFTHEQAVAAVEAVYK